MSYSSLSDTHRQPLKFSQLNMQPFPRPSRDKSHERSVSRSRDKRIINYGLDKSIRLNNYAPQESLSMTDISKP
jgi:hypothetical protein